MTEKEPLDLVILLKIVDYLIARPSSQDKVEHSNEHDITSIINNVFPGAILDSIIKTEIGNTREFAMRDKYTVSQAGAVGPKSTATGQNFSQIWIQAEAGVNLQALAEELGRLRSEMRSTSGGSPEEDVALSELAQAEIAAKKSEGPAVMVHLAQAGRLALDVAKSIGVEIAAKAIGVAMGVS
jgi:hypothetical protein